MAWADRSDLEKVALGYCAPRGIPLSVFLGRTVYPGDPQWLFDDAQAAIDWQSDQNQRCDGCGQYRAESEKKENSFAYRAEARRCHACYAIDAKAAAIRKTKEDPLAGTRYRLHKVEAN